MRNLTPCWTSSSGSRRRNLAARPLVASELGRDEIREVLLRHYRIVYRVEPHGITVLTVFEGHRLFPRDAPTE